MTEMQWLPVEYAYLKCSPNHALQVDNTGGEGQLLAIGPYGDKSVTTVDMPDGYAVCQLQPVAAAPSVSSEVTVDMADRIAKKATRQIAKVWRECNFNSSPPEVTPGIVRAVLATWLDALQAQGGEDGDTN